MNKRFSAPRSAYASMNPYEAHKHLINIYVLNKKGATANLRRDPSKDKNDSDILRENHKFIWEEDDKPKTWEEHMARKYYDKLYKEFAIADLRLYKDGKVGIRWQTEQELVTGKGQFICATKGCEVNENLRTWEINFAYVEHGEKKNALVKIRLCNECSYKLNYKHKRKEIKRLKSNNKNKNKTKKSEPESEDANDTEKTDTEEINDGSEISDSIWSAPIEEINEPSREEELEKYLETLLL